MNGIIILIIDSLDVYYYIIDIYINIIDIFPSTQWLC